LRDTLEQVYFWLIGAHCPYQPCGQRIFGWKRHACKGTIKQQVEASTRLARKLLDEQPMSRQTLAAYKALDALDAAHGI
jgi:hypothetical protein